MDPNLRVSFSRRSASSYSDNVWLNIEQEALDPISETVTAEDIVNMYAIVISGRSAKTYRSTTCPTTYTENGIRLSLSFYIWPSDMSLLYSLTTSKGVIEPAEVVELDKSENRVVPESDSLDFDYLVEDMEINWLSPSYNSQGEIINHPDFELFDNKIIFDTPNFSVVRFTGKALGYKHTINIDVEYTAETIGEMGFVAGDFDTTIQVTWSDENGEEQVKSLKLQIPRCIENMLNTCYSEASGSFGGSAIINGPQEWVRHYVVEYNPCNGNVIRKYWDGHYEDT